MGKTKEKQNDNDYAYYKEDKIEIELEKGDKYIFKYITTIKLKEENDKEEYFEGDHTFGEFDLTDFERYKDKCGVYIWYVPDNERGKKIIYIYQNQDIAKQNNVIKHYGYQKICLM